MAHLQSLELCVKKTVTTSSLKCQEWIDRGISQMYGFNHEDAIRCFQKALSFDKNCAIAHLYIAYCYAPNINNLIGLDVSKSYEETDKALEMVTQELESPGLQWETTLINAHGLRFSKDTKKVSKESTSQYACAMREVYHQFEEDADIAALFAESLMMIAPWELWTSLPDIKPAIPETEELVSVLEKALQISPTHPGLCHFYIHTMELSPDPERALPAAKVLRTRVPDQGHLIHMPSHIEMWLGHYNEAVDINKRAIAADETYVTQTGFDNEFYKVYRMHNYHFGALAAMFDGQFSTALSLAEAAEKQLGNDAVTCSVSEVGPKFLDAFASIPWHVLVRFGRWEEIVSRPMKEDKQLYPAVIAVSHYARGVAFAALGRLEEANDERQKFQQAIRDKSLEGKFLMTIKQVLINHEDHTGILDVAEAILDGEIEYHKGNYEVAYQHLRIAVKRDKRLKYDDRWGWMMPARHALGALLLEQGHAAEAEEVYREDLLVHKNNLWALFGLHQALNQQNKTEEANIMYTKYKIASVRADVKIRSSCFCATKAGKSCFVDSYK